MRELSENRNSAVPWRATTRCTTTTLEDSQFSGDKMVVSRKGKINCLQRRIMISHLGIYMYATKNIARRKAFRMDFYTGKRVSTS